MPLQQPCVEERCGRRGGIYSSTKIWEQLFALEHGIYTKCNISAHALFCEMKALSAPAERLNALLNAKWNLPQTHQAIHRLLNDPKGHYVLFLPNERREEHRDKKSRKRRRVAN